MHKMSIISRPIGVFTISIHIYPSTTLYPGRYLGAFLRAVFFLAFLMLTYFFSCLPFPFFDFDLDIICFILSFSCGYYAVSSVSVSAATRFSM